MKKVFFMLFLGLVAGGATAQVDPSYIDANRPDKEVLITKDSVLTYFNLGAFIQDSLGIPYDNLANGAVLVGSPAGGITSYPLQFYYSNTDKLLGIGTSSPEASIHIANNRVSLAKFERTSSDSAFFELANTVQTYFFQINNDGSFEIKQGAKKPIKIADQIEFNAPVWFRDSIRSYDGSVGVVGHVWTVAANGKGEWADPGTLTNDDQRFDTATITNDTLYLSLTGDGEPAKEIDLKPYSNTADDQIIEQFDISNDSLRLKLENSAQARVYLEDFKQDTQSLYVVGDSLGIRRGNKIDLNDLRTSQEEIEDIIGGMVSGNTETGITVDYNDPTGKLNFNVTGGGTDDQTIDTFELIGTDLKLSLEGDNEAAKVVDLSGLGGGSDDQQIDTLQLNGTVLEVSLEGDGEPKQTVDLAALQDGTGTDDQDLTLVGNTLAIENDPNTDVDLSPYLDNTDSQTLSFGSGTGDLTISGGNTVNLDGRYLETEVDGSVTNELQVVDTFRVVGTNLELSLSDDAQAKKVVDLSVIQDGVDDADNNPTNEIQTLNKVGEIVSLSLGGGSFQDAVNDNDADPDNEIQVFDTARLVGTTLELSLSDDAEAKKTVDLSSLQDGVFDGNAIHDNVDDEFSGVAQKLEPSSADRLLIEDSGAGFAKKWIRVDSLPNAGGGGGGADGVATGGTHDQINRELDITVAAPGSNFSIDISALPTDLEDLTDVAFPISYTNRNALIADGTDFHSRPITEADISDLQSYIVTEVDGSVTNELQDLDVAQLTGTNLELSLTDDPTTHTIDLSSLQDGTGTDNQNLDVGSFNTTTGELTIGIEDGTDQVIDLDGRYLETEVDGSVFNELQGFDVAQLTGTDLELSLTFDVTTHTIDLSSLQDGTGTDDQNIIGSSFNSGNGELTIGIEGGSSETVDLDGRYLQSEVDGSITNEGSLTVGAGTSTTSIINSNTSGSTPVTIEAGTGITLAESGNTITITGQSGSDDQNLDVGTFNTTNGELTIGIEDGTDQVIDLDGRYLITEVDGSTSNELQDFDVANLNGTNLELSLTQDATTHTIDLSSLQDGTGTDDQNLSFDPKSGTDVILNIQDGADVTLREGANVTLTRSASNLLEISASGDGTGTDDQNLDVGTFSTGTGDLTIGIEDGTDQVINLDGRYLQTEVDGSVTNELQDFDIAQLTGTDLELSLTQDATTWTVDLSSLAGGSGIDTLVNYDALRAYVGNSNVVYVQDFTVNFSGRDYQTKGGFFVKGGSGENGATLISGWQRVFDGVNFYPDWFEMNGFDETGTDNGILQDNDRTNGAIVLCNAAGGGVVKESPGLKLFGVGGNLSGVRYGVLMLDSVQLDMNGAVYKLKDAIIDGTFSIGMIYVVGRNKIAIRNGFIHGNALNQTFTTYEQNGKVQGIRMTASQADQCQDVVIENVQIDYVLGNPINLYASSTVYANDYQDLTVRNLRCFHYGEGPQFLNVNNLLVDQVYLDPDTPAVGDHFELVRCDGWTISNGRIIGGSGSGSGIDLYGNRNGTVQNWYITNTKDIIEIHKDSYSNYCSNIFINNLRGETRLETTPAAITFNNGQRGTRNIHFKGLYLKDYYQGLSFSGADSIPGPIIIEDFVIDSMTNAGINIAHVKDLRLINGEIKGCGNRGIFWNTYQDQTAETGKTSLKIENVHIHNNGLFGISLDLQNPAKTYWCDVDIHANVENNGSLPDIQIARALTDTHQINVVNVNSIYEPTSASTSVWGNTDFFPFTTLDQMSGADWQKIRVHGKSGGLTVQSNLGNNRLVLLDSASSMTLQADEWIDFQFNPDSVKWYETDRKNKTEIVNVNAKFTPSLVWPLLVNKRVPYWNGTTFTDDADFTYKNDELGFKRAYIRDSLNFGDDGITNRCIIRYSGNYLFYQSLVSNAGHLFRDHLNQTIMQLDNSNRGAQFYGPVSIRSELRDGSLSAGTSGQILRSTGSGVQWVNGLTGSGAANQITYWSGANTIAGDADMTFDGVKLDVTNIRTDKYQLFDGVNERFEIRPIANNVYFQNKNVTAGSNIFQDQAGNLDFQMFHDNNEFRVQDGFLNARGTSTNNTQIYKDSIRMLNSGISFTWYNNGSRLNLERENQEVFAIESNRDIKLGNYLLNGTQTVGAGQDNYVLKYDNATGKISLEADETGGGGGISGSGTANQITFWNGATSVAGDPDLTFDGTTLEAADIESGDGYEFVTGATNHADIFWDGTNIIYKNETAASRHIFQNNISQAIMTLENGTRDAIFENNVQIKRNLVDPGFQTGAAGQVATALGGATGWSWQDPTGIDSIKLDASPELGGKLHLDGNYFTETFAAGMTMTTLDLCTIDTDLTDGELYFADADDETRASGYLFLTTEATSDGTATRVITEGKVTGFAGLTTGKIYYMGTVAGQITDVRPSGSGQIVRKIGQALNSTTLYFKPDETWVENP